MGFKHFRSRDFSYFVILRETPHTMLIPINNLGGGQWPSTKSRDAIWSVGGRERGGLARSRRHFMRGQGDGSAAPAPAPPPTAGARARPCPRLESDPAWRLAVLAVGQDTITPHGALSWARGKGSTSTVPKAHSSAAHQFHNSSLGEVGSGFLPGDTGNKRHAERQPCGSRGRGQRLGWAGEQAQGPGMGCRGDQLGRQPVRALFQALPVRMCLMDKDPTAPGGNCFRYSRSRLHRSRDLRDP